MGVVRSLHIASSTVPNEVSYVIGASSLCEILIYEQHKPASS